TFARISRIFSRLTASIVATLTLSRLAGERASTVDRCPQPRMIVHQSSGVLSGCVPASATTTGSLTPHSTRRARHGSNNLSLSARFGGWLLVYAKGVYLLHQCAIDRSHVLGECKSCIIMWSIFNCEWPGKVLQELFSPRSLSDPEFKPFDLGALRGGHPS